MLKKTVKRMAIVSALAAAGVAGFAGTANAETASASSGAHVVQPGETLSGIAGSNWRAVAAANGLANPDLIYPGQVIVLNGGGSGTRHASSSTHYAQAAPAASTSSSSSSSGSTVWDQLAQCESSGNWAINTGNGYYGGLQFSQSSWNAAGGSGNPANASRSEQIRVAENLKSMQGWGAWPACSAKLGLR